MLIYEKSGNEGGCSVGTTASGAGDGDLWIEISGGEGIEAWRYSGGINRGS